MSVQYDIAGTRQVLQHLHQHKGIVLNGAGLVGICHVPVRMLRSVIFNGGMVQAVVHQNQIHIFILVNIKKVVNGFHKARHANHGAGGLFRCLTVRHQNIPQAIHFSRKGHLLQGGVVAVQHVMAIAVNGYGSNQQCNYKVEHRQRSPSPLRSFYQRITTAPFVLQVPS